MYSKEELVLKIILRGSSVIFKNYDYQAVMLSSVQKIIMVRLLHLLSNELH